VDRVFIENEKKRNMKYPETKFNPKWVSGDHPIDDDVVEWTNSFGRFLAPQKRNDKEALSTSQIRKFFGEVKRIQFSFEKNKNKIPFLKAKLAYATGKANKRNKINQFYKQMSLGIPAIKSSDDFNRYVSICESIIAFHRYYGGND